MLLLWLSSALSLYMYACVYICLSNYLYVSQCVCIYIYAYLYIYISLSLFSRSVAFLLFSEVLGQECECCESSELSC